MMFTNETIEKVSRVKYKIAEKSGTHILYTGLEIKNGSNVSKIFSNDRYICDVEDLSHMIEELKMFRDTIKQATGIEF